MSGIAVVDYGLGNLFSVQRAFASLGADVRITADPGDIDSADGVVLPGVGAFGEGIRNLDQRGFTEAIRDAAGRGKPTFGICLGMQLLMDESEELGHWDGLGLVRGRVSKIGNPTDRSVKVPQIGWNTLEPPRSGGHRWSPGILDGVEPGAYVYFVHSYGVFVDDASTLVAETEYGTSRFCSVLSQANIVGCQFHPENSAEIGLAVIRNFLAMVRQSIS